MGIRIDGFIIVDKPSGVISFDIVKEIKKRFRIKKVGHIGTLDPFATGVLPIALNEGTKLIPFLGEEPKEYEAVMKVGEETTTGDLTGRVTLQMPWDMVSNEIVFQTFSNFLGKIQQIPPMFSAIKQDGKRLYKLARQGKEIERKVREVEIFSLKILEIDLPLIKFFVSCSKGTYIRTLAVDIGRRLKCGAHLIDLRRKRSGFFTLENSIYWDTLTQLFKPEDLYPYIIPLKRSLPHLLEIIGDEELIGKVKRGQWLYGEELFRLSLPKLDGDSLVKLSSPDGELIAILKQERGILGNKEYRMVLRPIRIFNTPYCQYPQSESERFVPGGYL